MRLSSYVAAIIVLSVPLAARADDIFTLSDGTNTISFEAPSSPAVVSSALCPTSLSSFCIYNVPVAVNGTPTTSNYIAFYSSDESGGLGIEQDAGFLLSQTGSPLFVGSTSDPTFQIGSFDLTNFSKISSTFQSNFTVNIAATPEPSSFALLGTGLLGVAGVMKRRFA